MEQKKKICKCCGKEKYIFSKGRCQLCANAAYRAKEAEKPRKNYSIPRITSKQKAKRATERDGYGEFFKKHINIILSQNKTCQECGAKLQGLSAEVCHILSKSKSPEVATEDDNILYLCFYGNSCHAKFDSNLSNRESMGVFALALERYSLLKNKVTTWTSEVAQLEDNI